MKTETMAVFVLLLFVAAVTLLFVRGGLWLTRFRRETQRLWCAFRHADEKEKGDRWHDLRCHYLCLIPFVTEKNAETVYAALFRRDKPEKKKTGSDGLWHLLMPSLAGLCLCAVCLCGMSWAWFTASVDGTMQPIATPFYRLTVAVTGETPPTETAPNETQRVYQMRVAGQYTVALTAEGTPQANGYGVIEWQEQTYYTAPIAAGDTLTLTVPATAGQELSVTLHWGLYETDPPFPVLSNGDRLPGDTDENRLSAATTSGTAVPSTTASQNSIAAPSSSADDTTTTVTTTTTTAVVFAPSAAGPSEAGETGTIGTSEETGQTDTTVGENGTSTKTAPIGEEIIENEN